MEMEGNGLGLEQIRARIQKIRHEIEELLRVDQGAKAEP